MSDKAIQLMHGDSRELLKTLPENSVDSVVTDPPYMIGFMGKAFDNPKNNVAADPAFWAEVLRVLKPGGHLLSFGSTRTYHRMVCAIEDAGFEIRDTLAWHHAVGFPKSLNISKQIDKAAGAKREIVGILPSSRKTRGPSGFKMTQTIETSSATDTARQWDGWGTALKPATELICLARKPLSESTISGNVLRWGTGGLNIDASRIQITDALPAYTVGAHQGKGSGLNPYFTRENQQQRAEAGENPRYDQAGRWPANVIFSPEAAAELDRQSGWLKSGANSNSQAVITGPLTAKETTGGFGLKYRATSEASEGGASRFFFVAKPSQAERCAGLYDGNPHPTVKPLELFSYLLRLITPPGGTVLDPFLGSGSSGMAAVNGGFGFIGMEMEADYFKIAECRLKHSQGRTGLFADDE